MLFRSPNTFVLWEHAWAGALFASSGLELGQKALAVYLGKVPVYATIYGAFAAVPIFLVWIYLSWLIILMGAVIAAYAPSLLSQVKRWPDAAGHRFSLVLAVLRALDEARRSGARGLSLPQLSERLRTDPLQIEPVLEVLRGLDWVGLLDEAQGDEAGRMVLMCDPATTPIAPLAGQLLLRPDAVTAAFWQRSGLHELTLAQVLGD